jgi:tRNA threonylcarbamoyladenosine biosynthesis protein TsaE
MGERLPEEVQTASAAETRAWGSRLAGHLGEGSVLLLFGELGAGKTCLVKGIAAGLGLDPQRVHSPSFIMVNRYEGQPSLNHVDLYRLEEGEDFSDLGLEELFSGADVTVVEWAERLPVKARPLPRWEIHLKHAGDDHRRLRLHAVEADQPPGLSR